MKIVEDQGQQWEGIEKEESGLKEAENESVYEYE